MIVSFADKETEAIFHGESSKKTIKKLPANLHSVAVRKLDMLNAAVLFEDLKQPPGNRLEALSGNLKGWHSIRINSQWRIVFIWTKRGPKEVKIVDYHK